MLAFSALRPERHTKALASMSLLCSLVFGTPASPSICSADTQCANDSPVCCHGTCAKICMSASPPPSPGLPEEWLREEVPGEPAACTDDSQCRQKYETCCRWNDTIGGYGGEGTCAQVCTLSSVKQSPPHTTPPMQDASPPPSPRTCSAELACPKGDQGQLLTCCRWDGVNATNAAEGHCGEACIAGNIPFTGESPPPSASPSPLASLPPPASASPAPTSSKTDEPQKFEMEGNEPRRTGVIVGTVVQQAQVWPSQPQQPTCASRAARHRRTP